MANRRGEARRNAEFSAQVAANQAAFEQRILAGQVQTLQQQKLRDQKKAERLLFRSLRAAGSGFFESNPALTQTLGGSGVLG